MQSRVCNTQALWLPTTLVMSVHSWAGAGLAGASVAWHVCRISPHRGQEGKPVLVPVPFPQ